MTAGLAFFWGDDDLAAGRAIDRLAEALAAEAGGPLDRLDVRGDRNAAPMQIAGLQERLAAEGLFGGGTMAVVTNLGALTVRTEDRDGLLALITLVAPGSALVFHESTASGAKEPGSKRIVDAVRAGGGEVRAFQAPKAGQLAAWIEAEARERHMRLAPGAARELAARVGGFVTDGDADRRNQTRMAALELDKLALYRPAANVSPDDVRALVSEAVPGSVWALTDAIGLREMARASELLERLSASTPEQVLLAVLHRRIRELLQVAGLVAEGAEEASLPKTLGMHSYRVQQLAVQARRWSVAELEEALDGLLELDAAVKNAPGHPGGDARRRLGFTLWIAERVGRPLVAGAP